MISIYTVCNSSGECLYVGSTSNPKNRAKAHAKRFPGSVFAVIEEVRNSMRAAAEKAAILRFKNNGQANENKRLPVEIKKLVSKIKTLKVSAVYADSNSVEVEIIDQDSHEEGERERALTREDEIAAEFVKVG
jgi:predicted GIY-YIG superfamily endonuclease